MRKGQSKEPERSLKYTSWKNETIANQKAENVAPSKSHNEDTTNRGQKNRLLRHATEKESNYQRKCWTGGLVVLCVAKKRGGAQAKVKRMVHGGKQSGRKVGLSRGVDDQNARDLGVEG